THQSQQRQRVRDQLDMVRRRCGGRFEPLIVPAEMKRPLRCEEETSQRCRAFLFACLGGVAAAMNKSPAVEVFESGVGAVNLPLGGWMMGSRATKSCHPHFLRLTSKIISLAADRDIAFRLPFRRLTKAEVVGSLAGDLEDLARLTVSCIHYPL